VRLRPILVVTLVVGLFLPLFVTVVGAEYTTPIVWSNKKEYDPSETAYLYGYGFKPSTQVTITIVRPDLVEDTVQTSTDEFGYFHCQYLLDGVHGIFNVTATDGVNVATTTFDNSLYLKAWWDSHDSIYIYAKAGGLKKNKYYYIKYFDPAGAERRQSPTHTGVKSFTDNLTILPTFPNIFGWWTVKLYENDVQKRTRLVYIDRIVWTTDSTYTTLVTSFAQGETVYFKTMGLQPTKYYRFKLEMPNGTRFYVGTWTTGVSTMTGSYPLPSTAPIGTWKLHVREAYDADGTCEHHYVDCRFEVTTPPPPQQYYLTVRTDPLDIGTIPGEGWYNACTLINLTAPEFFPGPTGIRYRFNYWDVDGASQGIGIYEIAVHMDANHTATAHYITQYHLNLTTSPPGVTTPAGVGWYDTGTNAPIFAPEFISIEPGASRYEFNGWTTENMSEIADPSATSTTVLMDKAKTVIANYVTQYLVTFNQTGLDSSASGTVVTVNGTPKNFSQLPYSLWVDSGAVISYSYSSIISSSVSGKRFNLINVSGPVSPITVTEQVKVTGNYKTQYYLTVISPYGTTGGEGWYDNGTTAYATLNTSIVDHGNGTRRVFTSWSGDASGTNYAQSDPILMDGPKTATANWKTQFMLTVRTSGLGTKVTNVYNGTIVLGTATDAAPYTGWFDQNIFLQLDVDSPIYGSPTRYVFTQWSGGASGSVRPLSVTVNSPKDITANYKTQHEVTFTQIGLDSSASGTVVTVDGVPKTFGELPYTIWVDTGTVTTYSYTNVSSTITGKRFILTGVTGPASPITVTSPVTVTGNYKTQYEITFNQSGVDPDFTGTVVTIDGAGYTVSTLPASFWWDKDSSHTFSFSSPLIVDASKQYVWVSTSGLSTLQSDTLTITGSGSVTGNYVVQAKHQITFGQTGVSSDFTGTVLIIDGVNYNVTDLPISFMWDAGSSHTFAFQSPLIVASDAKQYIWTSTTGLSTLQSGSIIVSASGSVTGNYKTQYYLTVKTDPLGIATIPGEDWYNESTYVTLTAPTVAGYDFLNWDVDGDPVSGNPIQVHMNETHIATAHYTQIITYTLTITTTTGGTTNPAPGTYTYTAGTSVEVTAIPDAGYQLDHWVLDGSPVGSVSPISVLMDDNHTLEAVFAQITYQLTITTTTGGTTDPAPATYTYAASSSVSVTAIPEADYVFDHWELDTVNVGSANPYSLLMDADHTLHAVFIYSPPSPPLSVSISPLSASILIGDSVTFTSTVSGGTSPYTYQWYLNGNPVPGATSSSWTFTPTSTGIYYIYLKVTDANDTTAQSDTARITVTSVPVGGYSVSLTKPVAKTPLIFYTMLLAIFGTAISLIRRKRK